MKNFEISVLTANSRYLQTAALKWVPRLPGVPHLHVNRRLQRQNGNEIYSSDLKANLKDVS